MSETLLGSLPERACWPFAIRRHNPESAAPLYFHYSDIMSANLFLDLMGDEDGIETTLYVANLDHHVLYSTEPGVGWHEVDGPRFDPETCHEIRVALAHKAARRAEMGV
jgi:hypothetical protein